VTQCFEFYNRRPFLVVELRAVSIVQFASDCARFDEEFFDRTIFAGAGSARSSRLERTARSATLRIGRSGKENKMNTIKMRRPLLLGLAAFAAFFVVACDPPSPDAKAPNATSSPVAGSSPSALASPTVANPEEAAIQQLTGRWNGPEGIYISVTEKKTADGKQQGPRKFDIEIANLDGPKKYEGTAKGREIEFTRNGKTETVKAATGVETGMKGYENETNCLVVTKGSEGFCKKVETGTATAPVSSPASSPAASPAKK